MSKRFSPTAIGAFVVGSFALLVVAIVVVGAGRMFQKPVRFACFFRGGVNGLKVGAPVKFRGVQIGQVATIRLLLGPGEGQMRTDVKELRLPVVLEIDPSQLRALGGTGEALTQSGFEDFLKRGLRAQTEVSRACLRGCYMWTSMCIPKRRSLSAWNPEPHRTGKSQLYPPTLSTYRKRLR